MMIARLRGTIEQIGFDRGDSANVLIDVNGVGYLAQVSSRTRARLPQSGETATLLIEMQVREDAIVLYGFIDTAERDWFRTLTTVQGVGGRVALNILSVLEPGQLAGAILAQDRAGLSRADGVGAKLAARLVTELKEKANAWGVASNSAKKEPAIMRGVIPAGGSQVSDDAISALINLGYRPGEASGAVATALRQLGDNPDAATLIRLGLAELGRLKEVSS